MFKAKRISIKDLKPLSESYVFDIQENGSMVIIDNRGYFVEEDDVIKIINCLSKSLENIDYDELKQRNKKLLKKETEEIFKREEKEIKSRKKTVGIIYFVTDDSNFVKIGLSTDFKSRFLSFQAINPSIRTIHLIKSLDIVKTEKLFHEYFKLKRTKGEWFKLSQKDIDYILSGKYTKEIMDSIGGRG